MRVSINELHDLNEDGIDNGEVEDKHRKSLIHLLHRYMNCFAEDMDE